MGDTKSCPYCAEDIKAAAIKCRFCGEFLEAQDEQTDWSGFETKAFSVRMTQPVNMLDAEMWIGADRLRFADGPSSATYEVALDDLAEFTPRGAAGQTLIRGRTKDGAKIAFRPANFELRVDEFLRALKDAASRMKNPKGTAAKRLGELPDGLSIEEQQALWPGLDEGLRSATVAFAEACRASGLRVIRTELGGLASVTDGGKQVIDYSFSAAGVRVSWYLAGLADHLGVDLGELRAGIGKSGMGAMFRSTPDAGQKKLNKIASFVKTLD